MCRTSIEAGNSYSVLHYTPSILTAKYNFSLVLFPDCEDPLIHRVDNQPECMFAPRRMAKVSVYFVSLKIENVQNRVESLLFSQVVWKPVQNKAPDLYNFIENFNFDWGEFHTLLEMYNKAEESTGLLEVEEESLLENVACAWLNHEVVIQGALDFPNVNQTQPWYQNFPVTRKNHLYIGRILSPWKYFFLI